MKKLKETRLPLLNRIEVVYEIWHSGQPTPKKEVIKKQIATELKISEDLINLSKVLTRFGASKIEVVAEVYPTKEDLQKTMKKTKKQKLDGKEESKEQKA